MAFKPRNIIKLTGHPAAYDVLLAYAGYEDRQKTCNKLGITLQEFDGIVNNRTFRRYVAKFRKMKVTGELSELPISPIDVRKAFEDHSPEALEKLLYVMRSAPSVRDQKDAAVEILDRAGYVKIQKQLTVHTDAEAIIRELNKRTGIEEPKKEPLELEAQVIETKESEDNAATTEEV